ncbi:MAG: DUF4124 domain-containing protein, partial [Noviherbaspirillum sp.]
MLRPFLLSLILCASAPAFAIYKCEAGGKVTYSDTPCAGGKVLDIDNAAPADAAQAGKLAAQDKNTLKRLEDERRKQEAQEEKAQQRAARADAARRQKCASLERRQWWADEYVAYATGKYADRA